MSSLSQAEVNPVTVGVNPCRVRLFRFWFSFPGVSVAYNDFPCGLNGKDVVTAQAWLKIKDSLWVLLSNREEMMLFRELCCYFREVC